MAFRTAMSSKIPMVIILGATGTGKTKLSLELAQRYGTEIISADSMQIYKGLDIVTAKASETERQLVPHHLLDILEPHQNFTVVDFRNRALKIIDNLTQQGKIPIIVGGTNYYIESIVYKILVEDMDDTNALLWDCSRRKRDFIDQDHVGGKKMKTNTDDEAIRSKHETVPDNEENQDALIELRKKIQEDVDNEAKKTNEEVHALLKSIDPVMASRLHPNNRRKVLRSIEVWLKSGRRHSEVLDEQKLSEGEMRRPGATILFWLKCEQSIHDERLNARVDSMIEEGLVDELLDFHDRHNKERMQDGKPPDYTKGVFQTLGFKEFHEYLILSENKRNSDEGRKLLEQSIENMKIGTRRYARRQNKMILGRFLQIPTREVPPVFELDTTDINKWNEEVLNKAICVIDSFTSNTCSKYEPLKPKINEEKLTLNVHSSNYCDVCNRLIIGDKEYAIHLASNKHRKVLKKKSELAEEELEQKLLAD
ncbi:tRNA dimethylallyltransferase [Zerene cesonia]|uniref:tRNA dimethylallyltransferase n=1 Tax=Zerene cesonia TaxID=33412 RepID=UPI0018E5600C|nr:tRNA dimethylallyltransferase [Zerene cesonia]